MTRLGGLREFVRGFGRAEGGTVMFVFAAVLLPLMALVGGAIDYGRMQRAKGQLEAAADAAVLAAQMQYSLDKSVDYSRIVADYIAKNMSSDDKKLDIINPAVETVTMSDDGEMVVRIGGSVRMTFLTLLGLDSFHIGVESAAKVGGSAIEVALVLDNTGSMLGSKIEALKAAAKDLVNAVMVKENDEKVKVALVPFAAQVNIGLDNRNEPGLDIPANYSVTPSGTTCWNTYPNSTQSCTPSTVTGTCWNDGSSYSCEQTEWTCTGDPGDPVEECSNYSTQYYSWYGCMGSRAPALAVTDEDYGTQGVPGIMSTWNDCSVAPLIRLTNNKGTIISGIEAMNASGYTYIPGGLSWGWRVLSPQAPFSDGVAYSNKGVRKVIVLMTDGANTRSAVKVDDNSTQHHASSDVYFHTGWDVGVANNVTTAVCDNIKAAGMMLYTVSFDVAGDPGIQELLQSCAGNGGKYFNADDNVELADAFRQIGLALLNLRLSK
jgi:Flp pilus assembly protein TadG